MDGLLSATYDNAFGTLSFGTQRHMTPFKPLSTVQIQVGVTTVSTSVQYIQGQGHISIHATRRTAMTASAMSYTIVVAFLTFKLRQFLSSLVTLSPWRDVEPLRLGKLFSSLAGHSYMSTSRSPVTCNPYNVVFFTARSRTVIALTCNPQRFFSSKRCHHARGKGSDKNGGNAHLHHLPSSSKGPP